VEVEARQEFISFANSNVNNVIGNHQSTGQGCDNNLIKKTIIAITTE